MARVEPRVFSLDRLIEDVRQGVLRVPGFQRAFVWRRDQVIQLFNSVRLRYPMGSLLIWRTRDRYRSLPRLGPLQVPVEEPKAPAEVGYVLDGHQRLSTLFGALALTDEDAKELRGSDRIFLVYYDLEKEEFCHVRFPGPGHLPVRYLLSKGEELTNWIDQRRDQTKPGSPERAQSDLWRRRAFALQTTFAQYQLSYLDVTDASLEEAVNIFWRLNSQGSPVSRAEVFAALTWKEGEFDFADSAADILRDHPAYDNFGTEPVLRALMASLNENLYTDDWAEIQKRHGARLAQSMDEIRGGFGRAVEFLDRAIGASSGKVVPYAMHLVLLTEFFRSCPEPTPFAQEQLVRWLWASALSAAYSLGGTLTFDDAIARSRRLATGEEVSILSDTYPQLRSFPKNFHPKSARVRAVHLFLKTRSPRDLRTGLVLEDLLSRGMEDARPVVTRDRRGWRMASRLLVGARYKNPLEALLTLGSHPKRAEILASHIIPEAAWEALVRGEEDVFLDLREEALVSAEREFANKYVKIPTGQEEASEAEPEIDVEESPESEFLP